MECRYQQQCQDLRRSLAALQAERDESATQVKAINHPCKDQLEKNLRVFDPVHVHVY
jgi:hypothetical protein